MPMDASPHIFVGCFLAIMGRERIGIGKTASGPFIVAVQALGIILVGFADRGVSRFHVGEHDGHLAPFTAGRSFPAIARVADQRRRHYYWPNATPKVCRRCAFLLSHLAKMRVR